MVQATKTFDLGATVSRIVLEHGWTDPATMAHCLSTWRGLGRPDDLDAMIQVIVRTGAVEEHLMRQVRSTVLQNSRSRDSSPQNSPSGPQTLSIGANDIPGFQLLDRVASGASGVVWRAKQLSLDRIVAVKLLNQPIVPDANTEQRLYAEARAAAKLNHPNIVQALEAGKVGLVHYFVMEFVQGVNLGDQIETRGKFPEDQCLAVAIQIASALQHIHAAGLTHCDVKPRNILLTTDNHAKLADLGLARTIAAHRPPTSATAPIDLTKGFGTPYYNSPEQIRNQPVDARTDIYCLGTTLYHMATGRVPFPGSTLIEVQRHHLQSLPTPPDHINKSLSAGLGEIIETMLAKNPDQRYQSAEHLLEDLRAVGKHLPPIHARRDANLYQLIEDTGKVAIEKPTGFKHYWQNAAPTERMLVWMFAFSLLGNFALAAWVFTLLGKH